MDLRLRTLVVALLMIEVGMVGASVLLIVRPPDDNAARVREAQAYESYRRLFGSAQIGPAECRSEEDLDELDALLASRLAPPTAYATAWKGRPAVQLYRKWQMDAALLRKNRDALAAKYRDLTRRGSELLIAVRFDETWAKQAAVLIAEGQKLHISVSTAVPESSTLKMKRGMALTYAPIVESDRVEQARTVWQATARRLTGLPALLESLKMTGRAIGCWPR